MWDLFVDFEGELLFGQNFDPIGRLFINVGPDAGTPGRFTELARNDETIPWARVESCRLASWVETTNRYSLTADPQGQNIVNQTTLVHQRRQEEPPPPQQ
jgi:hypothetical protein